LASRHLGCVGSGILENDAEGAGGQVLRLRNL
jgi:hypothetical protein